MSRIGRAGASVTTSRHGVAYFNGRMTHRGWSGRRPISLAVDQAAGRADAVLAA